MPSLLSGRWSTSETRDRDAGQKLGCNRRSRATVGNIGTGCTFWYLLHMAEVCLCAVVPVVGCSALSLVLLLMCVMWSGRRLALVARPCLFRRPQSLAEIVGGRIHLQLSMREQPEPRTQHNTAKRKTGFQTHHSSPPAPSQLPLDTA